MEQLGRPLDYSEANFIRKVQTLYANDRLSPAYGKRPQPVVSPTFQLWLDGASICGRSSPQDDYELWLYLAAELRRRKISLPDYMAAITDFATLEAAIKKWEREKEVAHWQAWFESNETSVPPTADTLDLRLAFLAEEARLQWRTQPDAPFSDLKQAQAKRFAENIERGTLTLTPDATPLWGALYKPWSYDSWWSIRYSSDASRLPLNRLIRLALPPERFVNANGEPLARPAEPLRLQLQPPSEGGEDYELRLTTADGQEPPPIRFVLSGHPTLYITDTAIYAGPPRNALEHDTRKVIPAPAMETAGGIRFLHALNLPLPEHLAGRTKIIPVAVTLSLRAQGELSGQQIGIHYPARHRPGGRDWRRKSSASTAGRRPIRAGANKNSQAGERVYPRLRPLGAGALSPRAGGARRQMGKLRRRLDAPAHQEDARALRRVAAKSPAGNHRRARPGTRHAPRCAHQRHRVPRRAGGGH